MKRLHLMRLIETLAVATALIGLPTVAFAGIESSAHDFSGSGWTTEICKACHTPHNSDTVVTDAPLWDHFVSTQTYIPYPAGGTLDATVGVPTGISLLCLSCHDGVTALDSFGGVVGTTTMSTTSAANFGLDLSNDHPISFTYNDALAVTDGGLWEPTTTASGLIANIDDDLLFGVGNDQLECASCHDVHNDAGNTSLLRIDNAGSDLCLTCHNK